MMFLDRMKGAAALGAAMVIVAGASAPTAQAAYVLTVEQEGHNVVATGSGTIDLAGLLFVAVDPGEDSTMDASFPLILTGAFAAFDVYQAVNPAPSNFGSGPGGDASSGSGNLVGVSEDQIAVPDGYSSGTRLSSSATWDHATFASLGVTPGVYVWTWGSGKDADSFTLRITASSSAVIPEPSTWALLGVGFLGLAGLKLRARARSVLCPPPA